LWKDIKDAKCLNSKKVTFERSANLQFALSASLNL
jgi:hypothetical protein